MPEQKPPTVQDPVLHPNETADGIHPPHKEQGESTAHGGHAKIGSRGAFGLCAFKGIQSHTDRSDTTHRHDPNADQTGYQHHGGGDLPFRVHSKLPVNSRFPFLILHFAFRISHSPKHFRRRHHADQHLTPVGTVCLDLIQHLGGLLAGVPVSNDLFTLDLFIAKGLDESSILGSVL